MANFKQADRFAQLLSEGLGWGSYGGDESLIPVLKQFLDAIPDGRSYDYEVLMTAVGPAPAWMLIYAFCKARWINYGTSPRFGWLEDDGEWLWNYTRNRTAEELQQDHDDWDGEIRDEVPA